MLCVLVIINAHFVCFVLLWLVCVIVNVHLWFVVPHFSAHSGPGVCVNGQQPDVSGRNDCEVGKQLVVVISTSTSLYWNCWCQVWLP